MRAYPLVGIAAADYALRQGASLPGNESEWVSFAINAVLAILGLLWRER